ncbi:TPA: hypothetical protein ACH3X3_001283 [Trebouxia sp. C0006]
MYDADEVSDWVMRKGLQAKFEGDHAKTKADLRALHLETEQTHIPHVVKALWGEAHKVQHVVDLLRNMQTTADLLRNMQTTADLLRNMQTTGTFARPVAHILSYMVRHGTWQGISAVYKV